MHSFENTTHITEDGYRAILTMKYRQQYITCRAVGILSAIPFLWRLIYRLLLLCIGDTTDARFRAADILFLLLLLVAVWLWIFPKRQVDNRFRRTKHRINFQAIHQYVFLPEEIHMVSTTSADKFRADYKDITWLRHNRRWMVLYFARYDFTMLVDRQGFTRGSANACLSFLKDKLDGK